MRMIWPLKKKATRAPAPCGYDKAHYSWVNADWGCPRCAQIEINREDRAHEERLRKLLAREIVEEMKRQGLVAQAPKGQS